MQIQLQTRKILYNIILKGTFLVVCIFCISCSKRFMVINTPSTMPPPRILEKPPRVALVLGGGAFRGMTHLGVIKVLEDNHIPIDLIVGSSSGSMVGVLYADYPYVDSLLHLVLSTRMKDIFDFSLFRSRMGFISGERLQAYLVKHLHHVNIEETEIPFVAVTTDLLDAKSIALTSGPIAPSINASCAIPYIFEPVKMYGNIFVDGTTMNYVPTDIAKRYNPDVIIAIDIMCDFDTAPKMNSKKEVRKSSKNAANRSLKLISMSLADIWIAPELKGLSLMSSKDNEKLYLAGLEAGKKALPEIMELLIKKGILR